MLIFLTATDVPLESIDQLLSVATKLSSEPSDPHHLRAAQLRAIGLKVSDEFTVPLCVAAITDSCIKQAMRSPDGRP